METTKIPTKTKWVIDSSHSEISFKVKHLMISNVKGLFKEFGANISVNNGGFMTSDIEFWLNTDSIDTGDVKRDEHLKSVDFFDNEKHKQINFKGKFFEKMDNIGSYELHGDLTIKDITNKIKLNVHFGGVMKDPWGNEKAGYSVSGKINRKTWGLDWNTTLDAGGLLVSEEVLINCELEFIKQV